MKRFQIPGGVRLLFPLFFVSGFCGLIYESIWSHYLKLFLGHAAYAQTVVLVVFIGGMAIGAWLCGRFAHRIANPLLAYAAAEFVIGWFGIAFHRVYVQAIDWAYTALLPSACSAEGWCVASWTLAAALILPQSILLGTTFPLMTGGVLRALPQDPGRSLGLLYFLNSFGAVFGVLVSAFILVPTVGLPGATFIAGLLNVLLGLFVYLIARGPGLRTQAPSAAHAAEGYGTGESRRLLLWVALLTGLSSFVYEIVWIRMLSLVLGSSTHAFELMLAAFILGLALGGAWIRNRIDGLTDPRRFLAGVQILMGLFAVGTIVLYDASFDLMGWMIAALSRSPGGYVLFNAGSSLIAIIIMIAPTFMAGMTLPLITYLLMRTPTGERSIGYVYAWNTFGAIAGVVIAVHFGLPQLGLKLSLASAAMIDVLLGMVLAWPPGTAATLRWRAACLAAVAAVVAAAALLEVGPERTASGVFRYGRSQLMAGSSILFNQDGKTATISVVRSPEGYIYIQSNGKPDASVQPRSDAPRTPDEYTQVLLAVAGLAHRPNAKDVAIIGFGAGITTTAVLASPDVERVDTIEIEPAVIEGARHFQPANDAAYTDPRSRIVLDDAKSFFARSGHKYDLVVSEPSNPWVSGIASLFTVEFYGRVRHSLNPGGLLVQWIHGYEFSTELLASILNAMDAHFGDFVLYRSGMDLVIVATPEERLGPPLAQVFRFDNIRPHLERTGLLGLDDLDTRRVAGQRSLDRLLQFSATPPNSDYRPFVDSRAAESRFLNRAVARIVEIEQYAIPLVDLFERRRWYGTDVPAAVSHADLGPALHARMAYDAIIDLTSGSRGNQTPGSAAGVPEQFRNAYRVLLQECVSPRTTAGMWDEMVNLAAVINPETRPDRAEGFWKQAARSRCLVRLPAGYRNWLALFAAVGARDAERMTRLGMVLLDAGGVTPHQRDYLVLAALAGSLARGDDASARQISERWLPEMTQEQRNGPGFRALRALAGL